MSGVQEKHQDMDHQNQDKESDSKSADTETKQEIPDMQTSQLTQSKSPVRRAWRFFPCCCRRSPSPEPGGPGNKDSASCLQAHTSGAQSMTAEPAEPAGTSKVPSREKASLKTKSFLHRLFGSSKEHHARYHNKHRSEDVKDGVLNGCTHGEASRPRPSRDIPKSKNKMKQSCSKTNIKEVIDSEQPTGSETLHSFQECTSTVPHISTCDIHPTESKEEEADDVASGTWRATNKESDLTINLRTECQSSSASSIPSHTANSLKSLNSQLSTAIFSGRKHGDGCSLTSPLEQKSQPHVAPLPSYTEKYMEAIDSEQPTGSETLHSFQECNSTVTHLSTCDIHPTESKEEEADDAESGTSQVTNKESDLTINLRTESQSSSASPIPSHNAHGLQSLNSQLSTATFSSRKPGDGCSLTPPLEQTSQPLVAPLPPCTERYRTTDTLQSVDEASAPTSPGQQDDLNVDDTITLSGIEELVQEFQEEQEGATADENNQPAEDSSKETVCRPLPPYREIYNSSYLPYIQRTHQNPPTFDRWRNNQPSQATSSARTNFYQRQYPLVEREQDAVQDGNRTTDTLESANEAQGPRSSGQHDNRNVDDTMMLSHIKEQAKKKECQEEQEEATAAVNAQPVEDSSKETVCRPLPPYREIYKRGYVPYNQRTHQHLPSFQRWQNNQPSQDASARTNFYQRQHLLVERERATVQEGTRTTDRLSANDEAHGRRSSTQLDNLNVDDTLSHIKKTACMQGCEDGQSGATAAQNTQSVEDSSKETVCRPPPPPYRQRHTGVFEPYTQGAHQHLPTFQRWEIYQSKQAYLARTNFFQRHHPPVEREQDPVQEGTGSTDTLHSADGNSLGASSRRRRDNLNVDDTMMLNHFKKLAHMRDCKEEQEGATAAQNTQPVEDSSKETVCRPFPPYSPRFTRVFEPYTQRTHQYPPTFQRWQNCQPSQASSARTNFYQRQHPLVEREQDAVQEENRTTDPLQSADEASGASSSRCRDFLNVDDPKTFNSIAGQAHMHECEDGQPGTTAAQNTQSVEDSSKETVCRPFPPFSPRFTMVFEPYTQRTYKYIPPFKRWGTYQPRQASSARTNLYQRQHPLVERGQDAVQGGTRTTDTLEACNEATGASSSRRQENLNVDDTKTFNGIAKKAHMQECEEGQPGTTAAQNTQPVEDSSKETVYRTKERLSAGSSSGEEEDKCRICHSGSNSPTNPLLSPCRCSGSLQFVHLDCLKMWIRTKLLTRPHLYLVQICEVCLGPLTLDPATFDLDTYCRHYRPQILRWPGHFDERRMRFLRRPRQRRPPPEASDT